jgi:hypothetical protein
MTAPDKSLTVPPIPPRKVCANAPDGIASSTANATVNTMGTLKKRRKIIVIVL